MQEVLKTLTLTVNDTSYLLTNENGDPNKPFVENNGWNKGGLWFPHCLFAGVIPGLNEVEGELITYYNKLIASETDISVAKYLSQIIHICDRVYLTMTSPAFAPPGAYGFTRNKVFNQVNFNPKNFIIGEGTLVYEVNRKHIEDQQVKTVFFKD